jgi:MarR family 2-MHQ and catechol resistance regulon transcriptional repressor
VLRHIHRAEEQTTPGLQSTDLSERLLIRPASVTGVVDRLERAGLVIRDESPTDLRAKRVMLTAKGKELIDQALAVHGRQMDSVMGGLALAEQTELHRFLSRLGLHLETLPLHDDFAVG